MAWTELTRLQYVRTGGRYASDLTDAEWALIAPFLPAPKPGGRPRTTDLRDVFDAILYIAATGCQWRMLPFFLSLASDLCLLMMSPQFVYTLFMLFGSEQAQICEGHPGVILDEQTAQQPR